MLPGMCLFPSATLNVSVSPLIIADAVSSASGTTSDTAVVSAAGGTPTYTYAWTRVGGSTYISAASPSASTTAFDWAFPASSGLYSTTLQCEVTDSAGFTDTVQVVVTIFYSTS